MILAAMLSVALASAHAEPLQYRIDSAHTKAEFAIEHLGVFRAQGQFQNVTGHIVLDGPAREGSIQLDIPVASVATGYDLRDDFIRGGTMFDAASYPRMRFQSSKLAFEGDRLVRVDGNLTLRDVTRPVSFHVLRIECGREAKHERCAAEAEGSIRRREFAMDNWWPLIGDEVALRLRLIAVRE